MIKASPSPAMISQHPTNEAPGERWLPSKRNDSPPTSQGAALSGPPQLPPPTRTTQGLDYRREWTTRPRVVAEPAVGAAGDLVLPPLSRVFDANFDSSARRPRAATGPERLPSFASQGFAALKTPPAPGQDFAVLPSPGTSSTTPSGLPAPLSRQDSYFVDRSELMTTTMTTTTTVPAKPYDRPYETLRSIAGESKRASPPWARPSPYEVPRNATSTSPPQQAWREGPPSPGKRPIKAHVSSACLNCKKAHVACDVGRPCRRCINLGRTDTCIDVQHKKRGRPRLAKRTASSSAIPTSQIPMSLSSLDETKAAALHANEAIIRAMGQTYDMHGRRHSRSAPSSPTGERYRELAHSMAPPSRVMHHPPIHGDPRFPQGARGPMGAPPIFSLSAFHRRQEPHPDEMMDRPHTSHHSPPGPNRPMHEAVAPHHRPAHSPHQELSGRGSPPQHPQHQGGGVGPHIRDMPVERYDGYGRGVGGGGGDGAPPPGWMHRHHQQQQQRGYHHRSPSPQAPHNEGPYGREHFVIRGAMPPPPPHGVPPRDWTAARV